MERKKIDGTETKRRKRLLVYLGICDHKTWNCISGVYGCSSDIFSIISGACSAALVVKITTQLTETWQIVLSIAVSAIVSALTIGGKAFMKRIAISNSKDFVMFVARVIAIFSKDERKIRQKEKAAKQELKVHEQSAENNKSDKHHDCKVESESSKQQKTNKKQKSQGDKQ